MSSHYDHLIKVIAVGEDGVGKSKTVQALCRDEFIYTDHYSSTIGVDFATRTISVNDKKLKLQVWDTAGQERFRSVTRSYYRGASIILLCYSLTDKKSLAKLKSYVEECKESAPNAKFILVGIKSDLEDKIEVTSYDTTNFVTENYLGNVPQYIVSSKTKDGFEELRSGIGQLGYDAILAEQEQQHREETRKRSDRVNLEPNQFDEPRISSSFFPDFNKTKIAAGVGIASGAAAVAITVLAVVGIISNPIIFGVAIGVLAAIALASFIYAGVNHCQQQKPVYI